MKLIILYLSEQSPWGPDVAHYLSIVAVSMSALLIVPWVIKFIGWYFTWVDKLWT